MSLRFGRLSAASTPSPYLLNITARDGNSSGCFEPRRPTSLITMSNSNTYSFLRSSVCTSRIYLGTNRHVSTSDQISAVKWHTLPTVEMSTNVMGYDMAEQVQYRILPNNGSGWCWELMTRERDVIVRGIAGTHAQACIYALKAGLDQALP